MAESTLYRIEYRMANGDWREVGQIDSTDLDFGFADRALETWLARSAVEPEPGRYRVFCDAFGSVRVTEHRVTEKREWVVEPVERPQPATYSDGSTDATSRALDVIGDALAAPGGES